MSERRRFTREFKVEAVGWLTKERLSVAEAARRLGVGQGLLRSWQTQLAGKSTSSRFALLADSPPPSRMRSREARLSVPESMTDVAPLFHVKAPDQFLVFSVVSKDVKNGIPTHVFDVNETGDACFAKQFNRLDSSIADDRLQARPPLRTGPIRRPSCTSHSDFWRRKRSSSAMVGRMLRRTIEAFESFTPYQTSRSRIAPGRESGRCGLRNRRSPITPCLDL